MWIVLSTAWAETVLVNMEFPLHRGNMGLQNTGIIFLATRKAIPLGTQKLIRKWITLDPPKFHSWALFYKKRHQKLSIILTKP